MQTIDGLELAIQELEKKHAKAIDSLDRKNTELRDRVGKLEADAKAKA